MAGELDKIADTYTFEVATLRPENKSGNRDTEDRHKSDYGQTVIVKVNVIHMKIPFSGDPRSFDLKPTTCKLIDTPARVSGGAVIATFDDDDLDRLLPVFIDRVIGNLGHLRTDMAKMRDAIRHRIGELADYRIEKIRAQQERDKDRDFPIS